eukprot:1503517-Rhodomonas_salina.2
MSLSNVAAVQDAEKPALVIEESESNCTMTIPVCQAGKDMDWPTPESVLSNVHVLALCAAHVKILRKSAHSSVSSSSTDTVIVSAPDGMIHQVQAMLSS